MIGDITVGRGNAIDETITILDTTGAALNLTGATLWFTVKALGDVSTDDSTALIKLYWISGGASSGITVATPANGVMAISVTPALAATLAANTSYKWDVKVKTAAGKEWTPVKGYLHTTGVVTERDVAP